MSGMTCLCCTGGNCYKVGHVLKECQCQCIYRRRPEILSEEVCETGREFKREYVRTEELFRRGKRHLNDEIKVEKWDLLPNTYNCRRFVENGKGRCRVEYRRCDRVECGSCFQRTGRWRRGEVFVPELAQVHQVCEFFTRVVGLPLVAQSEKSIHDVMALKRRKNWEVPRTTIDVPGVILSGTTVPPGPEETWFGGYQPPFPTTRRVQRRPWDPAFQVQLEHEAWVEHMKITVGKSLDETEKRQAIQLLWTWKDVFVDRVDELPMTDLVEHTIPTYPMARAHRARDPIYAKDEIRWQTTILPEMIGTIVEWGSSPWVAKTTWISKKDTTIDANGHWPLRMVHTYCQLNDVTIKTNYPMKRMEPILGNLADPEDRFFFSTDAAYGFYAVPIYPPHAYKTASNTILGQFYYLRMPMGLTGAPATYARLKDLTFGPIPAPDSEPAVISTLIDYPGMTFKYFVDDDYGASHTFGALLNFLHQVYFPRIAWAKLTLKPSKSKFFLSNIESLGMMVGC